jgi:hypothetical protein
MTMAENRYTYTTSSGVRGDTVITAFAGIDSGFTRTGRVVTTRPGHDPAVSRAPLDVARRVTSAIRPGPGPR